MPMKKFKTLLILFLLLYGIDSSAQEFSPSSQERDINLLAMGDTMPGYDESYYNKKLFGYADDILKKPFDIVFFNFEGTMGIKGIDDKNPKCYHGLFCYTFMVNPHALNLFEDIKNSHSQWIFNMANNHSMDYGSLTQQKTADYLNQKFSTIGTLNHPYTTFEIRHQKVIMIGASPHHGTVSIFDSYLYDMVKKFKNEGYIVIVSLHMGAEGAEKFLVTNHDEVFAGGNRGNVYEVAHRLVNDGADLILAHGPHVLRGMEVYQHRLIAYSLGNFLTYGQFSLAGNTSYGGMLEVQLHQDGTFDYAGFYPTQQTKSVAPSLWNNGTAIIKNDDSYEFLKKISMQNFPQTSPVFIDEGKIVENSGKKCERVGCQ
jgi:hypothetical protein